ncbi:MAG: stage V sporulation protein AD [Clostridia bacterium]|nr:stage V sporulation protein AD [Clostridia bacterium]
MAQKIGRQTYRIEKPVYVKNAASVVGPREKAGPLGKYFEEWEDEDFGEDTWEKGESRFVGAALTSLLTKENVSSDAIDCVLSGDLENQCTASSCGLKNSNIPYFGVFGACSTMGESLALGSLLVDGGGFHNVICMTSSNFCAAEKQFRFPMELGGQKPPTAQCTVTGAGAILLTDTVCKTRVTHVTPGIIENYQIKDANNMGAAMAPACASTVKAHFTDTGRTAADYDLIVTGDLGILGSTLFREIMDIHGYPVSNHKDCGELIFDPHTQDTFSGGSGCGCSAVVLASYILREMNQGRWNRVLFVATGALMSPVSVKQGDPILGIAHGVVLENG